MKYGFLVVILSLYINSAIAQKDTIRLRRAADDNKVIVTDRAPQALYFQLGGSAPIVSVNYDRRFANRLNGLGFAAGLGFWGGSGVTVLSVPVSLNYLIGRKTHFIEMATGATFVTGSVDDFFDSNSTGSGMIYHINAGYRHQPAAGGFFFRGGISPLFAGSGYGTSFYLGFGYNF